MRAFVLTLALGLPAAAPALANDFRVITDQSEFVGLVANRDLTRFGITLEVSPDGEIGGSAFGRDVSGAWDWRGNFFCRDLFFGQQNLGPNCQAVMVDGDTVRFVADQGQGDHADFRLR